MCFRRSKADVAFRCSEGFFSIGPRTFKSNGNAVSASYPFGVVWSGNQSMEGFDDPPLSQPG